MVIDSLNFQSLQIALLCKFNPLVRSVYLKRHYMPPKEIECQTIDDMLEFLIKRLFI